MTVWDRVMKMKKNDKRHEGIANTLTRDEITTIIATYEFFGADSGTLAQIQWDLMAARYRVFDWLAMMVQGRDNGNRLGTQVLAYSFLKVNGDIDAFIEDLRYTDYDIDRSYEELEIND